MGESAHEWIQHAPARQEPRELPGGGRGVRLPLFQNQTPPEVDETSDLEVPELTGLLAKIEGALAKIDEGIYGQCQNCGEEIGLKRLEARPVAELCIDCKGEQEKIERNLG